MWKSWPWLCQWLWLWHMFFWMAWQVCSKCDKCVEPESPYQITSTAGFLLPPCIDHYFENYDGRTCEILDLVCDDDGDYDYYHDLNHLTMAWEVWPKCGKCVDPNMIPSPYSSTSTTWLPSGIPSAYPSRIPSLASSKASSEGPSTVLSFDTSASPNKKTTGLPSLEPSNELSGEPRSVPSSIPSVIVSAVWLYLHFHYYWRWWFWYVWTFFKFFYVFWLWIYLYVLFWHWQVWRSLASLLWVWHV